MCRCSKSVSAAELDAVNIVDADAAIVTNIGLDHLDWLGPDRETIGVEKAGIFRSGRPAIVAERDPPRSVFTKASEIGAHVLALGAGYDYRADSESSWRWSGAGSQFDALPMPGLQGEAQLANAAGVIAALQALRDRLPVEAPDIRAALPALRLRGRFERSGDWIFDVAHNAESAEVLARNLASLRLPTRPRLLLGMLSDKPVETVLRILSKQVRQIDFVSLPPPRGLSADELRQRAEPLQLSASERRMPCESRSGSATMRAFEPGRHHRRLRLVPHRRVCHAGLAVRFHR